MEEILELFDSYVLGQYLAGENYQFRQYEMIHMKIYEITREIRYLEEQERFIKITKFNDDGTMWIELYLDTKREKKKIKKVNDFFYRHKDDEWHVVKLFDDMKYSMRFKNKETFIEFFNEYITKGELI